MAKQKCSIENCVNNVNHLSYQFNAENWKKYTICGKLKPFFQGFSKYDDIELINTCACGNLKLTKCLHCNSCNKSSLLINVETLQAVLVAFSNIYKKVKNAGIDMNDISSILATQLALGHSYKHALKVMVSQYGTPDKTLMNDDDEGFSKPARITESKIVDELKLASYEVLTTKLVKKVQEGISKLTPSLGLNIETTTTVKNIVESEIGNIILMSLLSGIASFIPVPAKYEELAEQLSSQLRQKLFETIGSYGIDTLFSFISTDLNKDIKETIKEFKDVVVETPVPVEVTA